MTRRTPSADGLRFAELLSPVVVAAGYDLEAVAITTVGRRSVVRVIVDADGGVSLDGVAALSRAVSDELDQDGYAGSTGSESYTLEVSSPGVGRPLTEIRHWRRSVGRLVRAKADGVQIEGRVVAADDEAVVLAVNGEQRCVPYSQLGRGSVQVEFARREGGEQ